MKKLKKMPNKKISVYATEEEKMFMQDLCVEVSYFFSTKIKLNKLMRFIFNFLMEREDIKKEFVSYTWKYLNINETIDLNNQMNEGVMDKEYQEKWNKDFIDVSNTLQNMESVGLLIGNQKKH